MIGVKAKACNFGKSRLENLLLRGRRIGLSLTRTKKARTGRYCRGSVVVTGVLGILARELDLGHVANSPAGLSGGQLKLLLIRYGLLDLQQVRKVVAEALEVGRDMCARPWSLRPHRTRT